MNNKSCENYEAYNYLKIFGKYQVKNQISQIKFA